MATEPRCGNCRFGLSSMVAGVLNCHRNPPLKGELHDMLGGGTFLLTTWPQVEPKDWCGEWEWHGQKAAETDNAAPR